MSRQSPRLGLIADDSLGLHQLTATLVAAGYHVAVSLELGQITSRDQLNITVDAWVIEAEGEAGQVMEWLMDLCETPLVIGEGVPPLQEFAAYSHFEKNLKQKLNALIDFSQPTGEAAVLESGGNPFLAQARERASGRSIAHYVWVLAASMGGPEAVKVFLDHLPSGLPISFVYAQHIGDHNDQLLARVLGRDNHWIFESCVPGSRLKPGVVSIVPTDHAIRFLPMGQIEHLDTPWQGHFSPNIDDVIEQVSTVYQQSCGVIVFSGMSDDGARGAKLAQQNHSVVWCQSPDSCLCSSMPDATIAAGITLTNSGTPVELAAAMAERYAQQYVLGSNTTTA